MKAPKNHDQAAFNDGNRARTVTVFIESGQVIEVALDEARAVLARLKRRLTLASLPHRRADLEMRIAAYRRALDQISDQ